MTDFTLLLDALRHRMKQEIYRLPSCKVPDCKGIAWRNGYCYECVQHSTLQRMLIAQRETNILLRELIEQKSNIVPMQMPSVHYNPSITPEYNNIPDVPEIFIPTITMTEGTISGSGLKKSVSIQDGSKLDDVSGIQ